MSRKSVLSRRASSLVDPGLPLRAYFLSVGGALLLLLMAADWVLPAPLPSRLTDDSHSALPPIRIHSELKGLEAAVIDTSGFGRLPMSPAPDIAAASAQLPETELADTAPDISDNNPTPPADLRVRESLAQLQPAPHDQAGRGKRPHETAARPRRFAQAQSEERRRSARHPDFETGFGGCVSSSRERGRCQYPPMPN